MPPRNNNQQLQLAYAFRGRNRLEDCRPLSGICPYGRVHIANVIPVLYEPLRGTSQEGFEAATLPLLSGMFNDGPQSFRLVEHPKVPVVYLPDNVVPTG